MFGRAPVKRFNDQIPSTPAPSDYDVKEVQAKKGGVPIVKSSRFADPKDITPGPGQYTIDSNTGKPVSQSGSALKKHASLGSLKKSAKGLSRQNSNASIADSDSESEVFLTPRPIYTKASRIPLPPHAGYNPWREKCRTLETQLKQLQTELNQATKTQTKSQEAVVTLQKELDLQKQSLEAKMATLESALKDRDELEVKKSKFEEEIEENNSRIGSLKEELNLLLQDNKTLEESAEEDRQRLEAERTSLEEKATFLHFTQEQLNMQIEQKDDLVRQLQGETAVLKEQVASLHNDLEVEREKIRDVLETYSRENEDTLIEFQKLKQDKERLLAEKFVLVSKATVAQTECQANADEVIVLTGTLNDLRIDHEALEEKYEQLLEELKIMKSDFEVLTNDKSALDDEYQRNLKAKANVELDLAAVTANDLKQVEQIQTLDEEKEKLIQENKEIKDRERELNKELAELDSLSSSLEDDCNEFKSQQVENERKLEELDNIVYDLKAEVKELEMKTSSLEGSLSSMNHENAGLQIENVEIQKNLEIMEQNLNEYAQKNQVLSLAVAELQDGKRDLNETCLILESRMSEAEQVREAFQLEAEAANSQNAELTAKLTDALNLNVLLEDQVTETTEKQTREAEELKSELESQTIAKDVLFERLEEVKSDLAGKESERDQLVEMNGDLQQQLSDNLGTIKDLQNREQELTRRLSLLRSELDSAKEGQDSELRFHWQAEEEIAKLQAVVDTMELAGNEDKEQIQNLKDRLSQEEHKSLSGSRKENELSTALSNAESEKDNLANDLALAKLDSQEKEELLSKLRVMLKNEEIAVAALETQLNNKDTEMKDVFDALDNHKNRARELEAKVEQYREEKNDFAVHMERYDEMEELLAKFHADRLSLDIQISELTDLANDRKCEIESLKQELDPLQEECSQNYKDKYEALMEMVEPFKEQLEIYEVEKSALVNANKSSNAELKKLAEQHGRAMGHQNHKQKINYLVKLQTDNHSLKQKVTTLEVELAKQKRTVLKMERGSKLNLAASNKENSGAVTAFQTPVGGLDPRRKTMQPTTTTSVKSPLMSSSNRVKRK